MSNIKDVAKRSGYSISTVSYALSNNPKIPEETRDKIKKVAKEIGYKPNFFAKELKNKSKKNITIFLPGFQGPVHPLILSGVEKAVYNYGNEYNIIVSWSRSGYDLIYNGFADVAFVLSPVISDEEITKIVSICPVILFDKILSLKNVYNTLIDNETGIYKRVIDFYKKGQRKFVFLSGSPMSKHNDERKTGFLNAMVYLGLKEENYKIVDCVGYTERHGYRYLKEFMENNSFSFDAIIASNDELAIGAMKLLNELNIKIPDEVRVSGFDNIDKCKYVNPSLSTVAVDWENYGIEVGNLMVSILKDKVVQNTIKINTKLIDRISG